MKKIDIQYEEVARDTLPDNWITTHYFSGYECPVCKRELQAFNKYLSCNHCDFLAKRV